MTYEDGRKGRIRATVMIIDAKTYGDAADEELDVIPSRGTGTYLARATIVEAMSAGGAPPAGGGRIVGCRACRPLLPSRPFLESGSATAG